MDIKTPLKEFLEDWRKGIDIYFKSLYDDESVIKDYEIDVTANIETQELYVDIRPITPIEYILTFKYDHFWTVDGYPENEWESAQLYSAYINGLLPDDYYEEKDLKCTKEGHTEDCKCYLFD